MIFDGIVLAGGRSTRLGGLPKSRLLVDGISLLDRTLDALRAARRVVVVGDYAPAGVLCTRETPEFSGPAAGIGAGLAALDDTGDTPAGFVVILACDMPGVAQLVPHLVHDLSQDGTIALDRDGVPQYLAVAVRTAALRGAVQRRAPLNGASVRHLLDGLDLRHVDTPSGATLDVDTWEDAARFGIPTPVQEGPS